VTKRRAKELLAKIGSNVLVLVAHPDDEALGCGGTIARLSREGATVHIAFLADGVGSRAPDSVPGEDELSRRRAACQEAAAILGAREPVFDDLPDNRLDEVPLLEVIKRVEAVVARVAPEAILTHHAGDLNIDHRRVHQAVVTACRPEPGLSVRRLMFFEVASSTEWQTPGSGTRPFDPNVFVDVSAELDTKIEALRAYEREMRPWPHSRSIEAVEHRNRWLGASVGIEAAEGFILGRSLL